MHTHAYFFFLLKTHQHATVAVWIDEELGVIQLGRKFVSAVREGHEWQLGLPHLAVVTKGHVAVEGHVA